MKTTSVNATWLTCCLLLAGCLLAGCGQQQQPPPVPQAPTRDDVGYFCSMIVENHLGPKSQIFLAGEDEPLWFTSVRDGISFTLLPEEPRNIRTVFVTAMDSADWNHPELETQSWISAEKAWYIIGSNKRGGMGAAEAIPFTSEAAAQSFAKKFSGRVARLDDIPDDYILGNSDVEAHANP